MISITRFNPENIVAIPVVKSQAKNEMAFDIKDFRIDLKTKKLIITF